jgi:glycosyltransferase involved in cell wall biosynthesis
MAIHQRIFDFPKALLRTPSLIPWKRDLGTFRNQAQTKTVQTKCRLLYVVGQLGAGGLERQLYLLLQNMDRERYRPHVVVWNFNPSDTYASLIPKLGVPLHFFSPTLTAVGKMLACRCLVREIKPEIIHSYCFYTNIAASWATLGTKTIPVGSVRSNFNNDKACCGLLLGNLSARWPRDQIFNNRAAAESVQNCRTVCVPKRIFVVRNGIDLQQFPSTPVSWEGQVRILAVGSLLPYKRWDRLLKAAAILKKRGFDFFVALVGDGPLRESLESQARVLKLSNCVRFFGYSKNISEFLSSSTFLAHSSDVEGCPNVVMEAMACGRSVVAMDAGDIPSLVEDGKTGFVVRRGDDARFVERLATLISNRELCSQMGEASRTKAEREFTLDRLLEQTMAVYRKAGWRDV